jgi:hypothetical protein
VAWGVAIGGLVAGALWLALVGGLRRWRHRPSPNAPALFLAGPPGFRYLSNAANFFAVNPLVQLLALLAAVGLAVGAGMARR